MAERHLQPAPAPVDEPIPVTLPDGRLQIVPVGDPAWLIAWAYREVRAALEHAERDLRGKRALIAKLQSDEDVKRKAYAHRPVIEAVFERWRASSRHKGARLTPERFDHVRARLEEGYEPLHLLMAVEGLVAEHVVKNGTRYDDFGVCMRSGTQVERYGNLCPRDVREALKAEPDGQLRLDET